MVTFEPHYLDLGQVVSLDSAAVTVRKRLNK